jgi:hypothetical protein
MEVEGLVWAGAGTRASEIRVSWRENGYLLAEGEDTLGIG